MSAAGEQVSESASQQERGPRTRHYRDLIAWQKSMDLTLAVYRLTESMPQQERFGLTTQIRRSAVAVPSHIAAGHGRLTDRGLFGFLERARGSLFELQTQIELAATLSFVPADHATEVLHASEEVGRILNGLLKTVKTWLADSLSS